MAVLVVEAAVAEEEVEDVVLVVKVVGAKVDTEEVMAAVTDKAVMAVAMMDTEEATIITAEAQATAESRGEVVVRTKGTNPINGNHSLRPQCNSHCNRWFPISSLVKSSFH